MNNIFAPYHLPFNHYLEYIIINPNTTWVYSQARKWGNTVGASPIVLEARLPNGLGARWSVWGHPEHPGIDAWLVGFVD